MRGAAREALAVEARGLVMEYPRRLRRGAAGYPLPGRRRPTVRALDRVDLRLDPGETLSLLGTNGAGKTTLIKLAANLLLPTAGELRVCGLDCRSQGRKIRRRVGLATADERSFYWRLSPRRNLEFFASLRGMGRRETASRLDELGEQLGLEGFLDVPFSDLSSGMRQRVALARALLHRPQLLLLDEPTHSLSPEAVLEVDGLIAARREEGCAVLLATQSPAEACRLGDRLCVMHGGRILFCGGLEGLRDEARRMGVPEGLPPEELFAAYLEAVAG